MPQYDVNFNYPEGIDMSFLDDDQDDDYLENLAIQDEINQSAVREE